MTLLEIVQDILSDMTSDPVNSINDTAEALAIAQIVKSTYYDLVTRRLWPTTATLTTLSSLSDSARPTHFLMADNIESIEWIRYNKKLNVTAAEQYEDVTYLEPDEFISIVLSRNSTDSNIQTVNDISNTPLYIRNDIAPQYWTTFNDQHIICDAFDSGIDSTLQTSKILASVRKEPSFQLIDSFVPELPSKAFPYLLSEAKSTAFNDIKQAPNAKEEQKSRRQLINLSLEKWRKKRGVTYAHFGRK